MTSQARMLSSNQDYSTAEAQVRTRAWQHSARLPTATEHARMASPAGLDRRLGPQCLAGGEEGGQDPWGLRAGRARAVDLARVGSNNLISIVGQNLCMQLIKNL